MLLVTVNPYNVKKCKELDDNSPEKSDLKDPKTIAGLVKDGRFSTSYLPTGVYAEIREAFVCREQIMKQHVRLSNQIQGWLQKYFPEYFECYKEWDSTSGLMVKDYTAKAEQLKRLDEYLAEKVMEVPNVEKLFAIKGVGLSTVIGFVAEVGEIGRFTDPRQIQKLAGLEITKISSGKRKGQPGISKRGRCKLRRVMYESARSLITWNPTTGSVKENKAHCNSVRPPRYNWCWITGVLSRQ